MNQPRKLIPSIILFAGDTSWRIAASTNDQPTFVDVPIAANLQPRDVAQTVADSLQGMGYEGQPALLVIPASWCLAATIQTADLPKGDRKAMLYRLEEKLPLSAEELIADFIIAPQNGMEGETALGVAVRTALLQPLVESLEAADVAIQSVTPIVLAAAQSMIAVTETAPVVILIQDTDADDAQISLLTVQSGALTNWSLLARDVADIKLDLAMLSAEYEDDWKCRAISVDSELVDFVSDRIDKPIKLLSESVFDVTRKFGEAVLAGLQTPWIDFRRGPLAIADRLRQHRQSLNRLVTAGIILLLVSTAVTFFRAERYGHLAASLDNQMLLAFRDTFPGWAVPTNLKAVVEAEHQKAETATGNTLPAEGSGSAVQTLHDVLTRLPTDGRYSLDQLTFEPEAFQVQGRLQSYEEVDALASAARGAGMDVQTPLTRKGSDGFWSFTLRGNKPVPGSAAVAKGDGG